MGRFAPYFGKLLTHDQSLSFEKFNQPKLIPKKFFFSCITPNVAAPSYKRADIAMHYSFNAGNGYWIPTKRLLVFQP